MGFAILKQGGYGENFGINHKVFMVADASDLNTLPTCAVGSVAFLADGSKVWMKDLDDSWVETSITVVR